MRWLISLLALAVPIIGINAQTPVIITCGQSNTDGRVTLENLPSYINYEYCRWAYDDGTHPSTGLFNEFWPYSYVAGANDRWGYDAITYYWLDKAWQKPFYVIKESLGGTAIDPSCENSNNRWYWSCNEDWLSTNSATIDGGKSLMLSFEKDFLSCLYTTLSKLQDGYDIKAILWHQGESDYMYNGPDNYYNNLTTLISHMRGFLAKATGNDKYLKLPFILGTVSHNSKQYNAKVEQAQLKIASEDGNVYAIDMSKGQLFDGYHFDATSAVYLGREVYKQLCDIGIADNVFPEYGEDLTSLIVNPDFELNLQGALNPSGTVSRGVPYGWNLRGNMVGTSFGINQDAKNQHATNVCWFNSTPMPSDFKLSQVIPSNMLGAGEYRLTCLLWGEVAKKTSCRVFANENMEYYGYKSDYTNLISTTGNTPVYAGHAGGESGNFYLCDMELDFTLSDGEPLEFGVMTGNKKNDGTSASDNSGWFKVDNFQLKRVSKNTENTAITSLTFKKNDNNLYNVIGQKIITLQNIYIVNGRKYLR